MIITDEGNNDNANELMTRESFDIARMPIISLQVNMKTHHFIYFQAIAEQ